MLSARAAMAVAVALVAACGRVIPDEPAGTVLIEARYRDASVIREPALEVATTPAGRVVHVAYTSDEYCAEHECSALNIAYRSSEDGFATRHDVTTSASFSSRHPQLAVAVDGTVTIVYVSRELNASVWNLAMRTRSGGAAFTGRRDLTTSTDVDVLDPAVTLGPDRVLTVAYTSGEYCAKAGCSHRTVAVRSSADNFFARKDLEVALGCDAINVQLARGTTATGPIVAFWELVSRGSCTSSYRVDNAAHAVVPTTGDAVITRVGVSSAPTFAVTRDGTPVIAFYSLGPWHQANSGCPLGWQYYLSTAATSYSNAAATPVPGSCGVLGYPGPDHRAALVVDPDDDEIHIAYLSSETLSTPTTNTLAYRRSTGGFDTPVYITRSDFGAQIAPMLDIDDAGMATFASVSLDSRTAGLNVYDGSTGLVRQPASATTRGGVSVATDTSGTIYLAIESTEYCLASGCSRHNISVRTSRHDPVRHLTRFADDTIEVASFRILIDPDRQELELVYGSNEEALAFENVSRRSARDDFETRAALTSETASHAHLQDVTTDPRGVVHFATMLGQGRVGHHTTDGHAQTVVNPGASGSNARLAAGPEPDQVTIHYGGNESGAWSATLRSSEDAWASAYSPPGSYAWTSRAAAYDADGDLVFLYTASERDPGILEISTRRASDGFENRQPTFELPTDALAACLGTVDLHVGSDGVHHVLYASTERSSTACNVAYRSSRDWDHRVDVTDSMTRGATPLALLTTPSGGLVACYTTNLDARCVALPR